MKKRCLRALLILTRGVAISIFVTVALCVLCQDFLVFPQLIVEPWDHKPRDLTSLPNGVESLSITTHSGNRLEVWRIAQPKGSGPSKVSLMFHGNGGRIENFYPVMLWFFEQGFTVYGMEYRGHGVSTGWPSVSGITSDAEETVREITARESIDAAEILPVGVSLGTGFAAYVAHKFRTKGLVLYAPYTSLKDVARTRPWVGHLTPFMWNNIRTVDLVAQLSNTCVIDAHGTKDSNIPVEQSRALAAAYVGARYFIFIEDELSEHNDIFPNTKERIRQALQKCGL